VLAECAILDRPLTIADLPDLLPAVLEPVYDQVLPAWFGGDPVVLPEQMPRGLPATAARELAAALAPERSVRAGRGVLAVGAQPGRAGDPVILDEAGLARLLGFLAQIADRRGLRGRRYPLTYLLALPMLAMSAGHLDPAAIGEWVHDAPTACSSRWAHRPAATAGPAGPTPRRSPTPWRYTAPTTTGSCARSPPRWPAPSTATPAATRYGVVCTSTGKPSTAPPGLAGVRRCCCPPAPTTAPSPRSTKYRSTRPTKSPGCSTRVPFENSVSATRPAHTR